MKFYLLFFLIPIFIFSIIRDKQRRKQAAEQAERTTASANSAMREMDEIAKASSPAAKTPEKPVHQPSNPVPVHTEGKHPDEILKTRENLIIQEKKNAELEATRREIREMDLKKLRSAVVISEILDRPVSLRRRSFPR